MARRRFEHDRVPVYYGGTSFLDISNERGRDGWKVAAFIPVDGERVGEPNLGGYLLFEREVF